MDQIQVDVVEAEFAQAHVEGVQGLVVAVLVVPDLRGDEHVLARQPGPGDALADAGLVVVERGGVDMAVAGFQGDLHGIGRRGIRDLVHTEPELGDAVTVIERKKRRGRHLPI